MTEPLPIYLDHNATTPVDPTVRDAMWPYFTEIFGNPSSVEHVHGARAQAAVSKARETIADALGARGNEIIFTGSCTEANNLAILGAARARPDKRHFITSAVEHPAVLEPMRQLEAAGYEITRLPVNAFGQVTVEDVAAAIRDDTGLVSIMGANNEVGSTNPLAEIGAACEARDVLFHSDLAQVAAHRRIDVAREHVHLASLSGHKAYGPKGVGVLYVRSRGPRAKLEPLRISARMASKEAERLTGLADRFRARILSEVEGAQLNGHPTERLPGHVSLSIEGVEPLALMHRLKDVASFSASSACATNTVETSHVLLAMFGDGPRARLAFRVSAGRFTTPREMATFTDALVAQVGELRRFAA